LHGGRQRQAGVRAVLRPSALLCCPDCNLLQTQRSPAVFATYPRPILPQVNQSNMSLEFYRALHTNFSSDPHMTKAQGKLAAAMAADLGMAPKRADLQEALGQEGAAALSALVACAMRAWLRVNGCPGQGLRISVAASKTGGWRSSPCCALQLRCTALDCSCSALSQALLRHPPPLAAGAHLPAPLASVLASPRCVPTPTPI
jgi:hypothetical protein